MRVLIAYDGSEYAIAALQDLRRAGLHDVEALVLSVAELWLPPAPMLREIDGEGVELALREYQSRAVRQARDVAVAAELWLREHFPHWAVQAEGAAGSPVEVIIRRADAWPADLVVIGAHGRAAAPRMLPGSVLLGVLRHVARSVRISRRPAPRGDWPTRLIVAVDGSADSGAALSQVRSRVWAPGTEVRVLGVVDTRLFPLALPGLEIGPTCERWVQAVVERSTSFLRDCGIAAFSNVTRGDPKHVIVEEARSWAADCIFLGARGLTQLPWLHLGGVSTAVAMRAPCTVEVIRPPVLSAGEAV